MISSEDRRYPDLHVIPQILRDVPLATFYLAADPSVTASLLPDGLSPAPDGRIVLNMWSHSDARETTGFGGLGAMGIAYLAVEVAGEGGATTDGKTKFPARCWMQHWSNYAPARAYAAKASGLIILPGQPNVTIAGDRLTGSLELEGRRVISVSAPSGPSDKAYRAAFLSIMLSASGRMGRRKWLVMTSPGSATATLPRAPSSPCRSALKIIPHTRCSAGGRQRCWVSHSEE